MRISYLEWYVYCLNKIICLTVYSEEGERLSVDDFIFLFCIFFGFFLVNINTLTLFYWLAF